MNSLKSIKLYFFSILKIIFLECKNFYYKTSIYNKNLANKIPSRFFYIPSSYLIIPLTTSNNKIYKMVKVPPDSLWKSNFKKNMEFDNLNNFLWLAKLDRKTGSVSSQAIIDSWINKYSNYQTDTWSMDIMPKRIIAWLSNTDITFDKSTNEYKKKFLLSITKQTNHLLKNIKNLQYDSERIICCAGIILTGLIFKEIFLPKLKVGIKELERTVKVYFNKYGFPKSRNPEEVYICLKYLILIKEWIKEAQETVPEFLNEIIYRCGNCYSFLSNSQKKLPLFNGATEVSYENYDIFLRNLKYKFENKDNELSEFIKIKRKKFELFLDVGNPPLNDFTKNYQSGCLSFEIISNGQKLICNSGYAKYFSSKFSLLSCSTAAHSTLYLNNNSSNTFHKNKIIRKVYGNCLIKSHKILDKFFEEDDDKYFIRAGHNGYVEKYNYVHTRSIKVLKKQNKIIGSDTLSRVKNYSNMVDYSIRFHLYPGAKIAKTQGGKSILISLINGEGWCVKSSTNNLKIERNIFFGNKNKIINNECILMFGQTKEDLISLNWEIERIA